MSQSNETLHYEHIRREYSKCPPSQIIDRLIQEMQINDLKSRSLLKMEKRIAELESQVKTRGISLTVSKQPKLQQLKEAYQMRNSRRESATARGTPGRETLRSQIKYRELNSTRTPQKEELIQPSSPGKYRDQLWASLQQSTRTIAELSSKNQSLQNQLKQIKEDVNVLASTHDLLRGEIRQLKRNEQALVKQNQELALDCKYQIQEYQKSVQIIEKLLEQLEEFKSLHCEKSEMIKDITITNNQLEGNIEKYMQSIDSYVRSIDDYEKRTRELVDNEGEYQEQIKRLQQVNMENQTIIERLGIQNGKIRESLELQIRNASLLQQMMKEMRQRNHTLQKKILAFQSNRSALQSLLNNKDNEISVLNKTIAEYEDKLARAQSQHQSIREEFIKTTQEFKEQLDAQLRLISGYEKIQKPKQLSTLKQKFKGQQKKEFKLNEFHMKLSTEKPIEQSVSQKSEREERAEGLRATSEGLRGLVVSIQQKVNQLLGTHDVINQKTTQLNKRIPDANH